MTNTTFWKPERIDVVPDTLAVCPLLPLGPATTVASKLMDIPRMHVFLSTMTFHGYLSFLWNVGNGVTLALRDEPELGDGGVFSISVLDKQRVSRDQFYRLYVQVFEMFEVVVLDEGRFVGVRQFKR